MWPKILSVTIWESSRVFFVCLFVWFFFRQYFCSGHAQGAVKKRIWSLCWFQHSSGLKRNYWNNLSNMESLLFRRSKWSKTNFSKAFWEHWHAKLSSVLFFSIVISQHKAFDCVWEMKITWCSGKTGHFHWSSLLEMCTGCKWHNLIRRKPEVFPQLMWTRVDS